jgi:hypothetical protein
MSNKKKPAKRTATRYTSTPSAPKALKAKEVPAKIVEVKLPAATVENVSKTPVETRIETPASSAATALIAGLRSVLSANPPRSSRSFRPWKISTDIITRLSVPRPPRALASLAMFARSKRC